MSGHAAVPSFRGDLLVRPRPDCDGKIYEVEDSARDALFEFRDYELSVAQLLDGTRSLQQVVDYAHDAGMPISEVGLKRFIARLHKHGLVNGAIPEEWSDPTPWAQRVRTRFDGAIRAFESNRLEEAHSLVQGTLELQPDHAEALRLRDEIQRSESSGRRVAPRLTEPAPWIDPIGPLETDRRSQGATRRETPSSKTPIVPKRRSLRAMLVILGGAMIAASLAFPIPSRLEAPCRLSALPERQRVVRVATRGTFAQVMVTEGEWVEAGAVLARFDVEVSKRNLAEAESKVASLAKEARLAAAELRRVEKLVAQVKALETQLAAALEERDRFEAAGRKARARLAAAGNRVAELKAVLEAARVAAPDEREARARAASLISERDAWADLRDTLKAEIRSETLKAPVAGVVTSLAASDGQGLDRGAPFAKLVDPRVLEASLWLEGSGLDLSAGQSMTVVVDGHPVAARIASVTLTGPRVEVRATLENPDRWIHPGTQAVAQIDAGRRSLIHQLAAKLGR